MRATYETAPDPQPRAVQFGPDPKESITAVGPNCQCACAHVEVEKGLEDHLERLWRFALVRCGDQAMADDLVQSTCLRALEKAHQFAAGSRLDSWLFKILESIWRNTLRSQNVRRGNGIIDITETSLESGEADEQTRVELADTMRAIQDLPEEQSAVLVLVCAEGQSYAETAAILDVPVGTIMSRLSAARKRLKAMRGSI